MKQTAYSSMQVPKAASGTAEQEVEDDDEAEEDLDANVDARLQSLYKSAGVLVAV